MRAIDTCRDIAGLRDRIAGWRAAGERVALVPTMGALHEGHAALVRAAARAAERTVVSIFVNPTQFAPGEDFASYPRSFDADREAAAQAGAALVYAPDASVVYPVGFATAIEPGGPARAGLEDRVRPTHFAGVATVVTKLLLQTLPDVALFGEKDWQQLRVIDQTVRDLDIPVAIRGVPTVREADGLALSSRNRYLDAEERRRAPLLFEALRACAASGATAEGLAAARDTVARAGFIIDYVERRHALTLAPVADGAAEEPARLLAAARLGGTRLIDNLPVVPLGKARRIGLTGN